MRKIYLAILALTLFASANLIAQCTLSIGNSANDTVCAGQPVTLTANAVGPINALTTTMAAGNNHRGNMFTISALNQVTITSFDAHPMGNTTIEIYYRSGTYVGFETSSAGWTLIGSAAVTALPTGTPTPVPVPVNVNIPAGQSYSFYVTSTNTAVSLNYSNGTTEGAVFTSDANIQFREGCGMEYPFSNGGGVFRPRNWNGVIHYTTPGAPTYLWSTGGTVPSIVENPAVNTVYTVQVNMPGCPSLLNDTLNITISTPTANAGSDFAICAGDSATLTGAGTGNGLLQYFWDQAVTNGVPFQPFMTQDYVLSVTDAYGCTATDTVTIPYNALPVVNAGTDSTICFNSMYTLSGSGAMNYSWDNGITDGVPFAVTASITYAVIGTDSNGCVDSDSVTVTSNSVDVTTTTVNETITANDSTATYQWIDCNTMQALVGETNQSFTATVNGSYAVVVNNGICSDTSACEIILSTGINSGVSVFGISVYPNPNEGLFTLSTGTVAAKVEVTDVAGKQVINLVPNRAQLELSLFNEESGIYFVKVTSEDGAVSTIKVVKQ